MTVGNAIGGSTIEARAKASPLYFIYDTTVQVGRAQAKVVSIIYCAILYYFYYDVSAAQHDHEIE